MTTSMEQLANIADTTPDSEAWMMPTFIAMPTGPYTYDVAPVEVSMVSEVPEYGWDDDGMLGGEVVLILASQYNIQQCTMVNGRLEAKE